MFFVLLPEPALRVVRMDLRVPARGAVLGMALEWDGIGPAAGAGLRHKAGPLPTVHQRTS